MRTEGVQGVQEFEEFKGGGARSQNPGARRFGVTHNAERKPLSLKVISDQ
jgi:hypothetical protein